MMIDVLNNRIITKLRLQFWNSKSVNPFFLAQTFWQSFCILALYSIGQTIPIPNISLYRKAMTNMILVQSILISLGFPSLPKPILLKSQREAVFWSQLSVAVCNITLNSRTLMEKSGKRYGQIKSPSLEGPTFCWYRLLPDSGQRVEIQLYRLVSVGRFNGTG